MVVGKRAGHRNFPMFMAPKGLNPTLMVTAMGHSKQNSSCPNAITLPLLRVTCLVLVGLLCCNRVLCGIRTRAIPMACRWEVGPCL